MNTKYFAIVATIAAVLVGATTLATADSASAYDKSQATSQANACGNGFMPTNVGCQNTGSQIQGDENAVTQAAQQTFPEFEFEFKHKPKPIPKPIPDPMPMPPPE